MTKRQTVSKRKTYTVVLLHPRKTQNASITRTETLRLLAHTKTEAQRAALRSAAGKHKLRQKDFEVVKVVGTTRPIPESHIRQLVLERRSIKQWVELIVGHIPHGALRRQVALLVWWDWYGHLTLDKRVTAFDAVLENGFGSGRNITGAELYQELVKLGYDEERAQRRVGVVSPRKD